MIYVKYNLNGSKTPIRKKLNEYIPTAITVSTSENTREIHHNFHMSPYFRQLKLYDERLKELEKKKRNQEKKD